MSGRNYTPLGYVKLRFIKTKTVYITVISVCNGDGDDSKLKKIVNTVLHESVFCVQRCPSEVLKGETLVL